VALDLVFERLPQGLALEFSLFQSLRHIVIASYVSGLLRSGKFKLLKQFLVFIIQMLDFHLESVRVSLHWVIHLGPVTLLPWVLLVHWLPHIVNLWRQVVIVLFHFLHLWAQTTVFLINRRVHNWLLPCCTVNLLIHIVKLVLQLQAFMVQIVIFQSELWLNVFVDSLFQQLDLIGFLVGLSLDAHYFVSEPFKLDIGIT